MNSARLEHLRRIARLGGLARVRAHGNPGTAEGRKKGGINSLVTHTRQHTSFSTLRKVTSPRQSENLAELMGILMGDGHRSTYQISVTTNSETDMEHARFVQKLLSKMFVLPVSRTNRKKQKAVVILASSRRASSILKRLGMPEGNKMNAGMVIPQWVKKRQLYARAFIRGLFDTDGCVYLDRHRYGDKVYFHMGWTITSAAGTFIVDIEQALRDLGFSPTRSKTQQSVYLRRQAEIVRYFEDIGTHNPKHRKRYRQFRREIVGRVPKRS